MNRKAGFVFALLCACHKREDAASTAMTAQPAPPPADSTVVASPAPSDTVAPPVASASAARDAGLSPEEARREALMQAREVGMIGLLNSSSDAGLGSVWGRDDSLGRGNMWGDAIGDDAGFGAGGLGLRGTGAGGGTGEGIGLGNIGTLGHGSGTGSGMGYGSGSGRLGGGNHPAPSVRAGATTVSGRLPPEVIQRIVRQNMGRFRLCYENGLRTDPKLAGSIAVRFVIDPQGAVSSATRDPSSTMTDASVVSCVTRAFSNLYFPAPEGGGSVSVMYPLNFSPG